MTSRPLFCWACSFICGIWFCLFQSFVPIAICAALLLHTGAAQFHKMKLGYTILYGFIFCSVFVLGYQNAGHHQMQNEHILSFVSDGDEIIIQGELERKDQQKHQVAYLVRDCTIFLGQQQLHIERILVYPKKDSCLPGQILRFRGKVTLFDEARNLGNFDAKSYYWGKKILFAIKKGEILEASEDSHAWKVFADRCRSRLKAVFESYFNEQEVGLIEAMTLGDKSSLGEDVKTLYSRAGIAHVLAVSGLHISILGMGVYRILRKRRFKFITSAIVGLLLICLFDYMTGAGISTRRAVLMFTVTLLAQCLGRTGDMPTSVGISAAVMLVDNPFLLTTSAFLLSYGAVFAVGITTEFLWQKDEENPSIQKAILQRLQRTLKTSMWISFFTWPILSYFFFQISICSILLNLIVLPLMTPLVGFAMLGGIFGVVFGTCSWPIKMLFFCCRIILRLFERLSSLVTGIPFMVAETGQPSAWKLLIYYLLLLLWIGMIYLVRGKTAGKGNAWISRLPALLLLFLLFVSKRDHSEICILDVGQGDGIYLHTQNGYHIMIDGGSTDVGSVGKYRILPFLQAKGVQKIDYWFLSHLDEDHICGLVELLEMDFPVGYVVLSEISAQELAGTKLLEELNRCGVDVMIMEFDNRIDFERMTVRCIWPQKGYEGDANGGSLGLLIEMGEFSGIFLGDISSEEETKLLEQRADLERVTLYKCSHHGSNYSSSEDFLRRLRPDMTTISCGLHNSYGHPGKETVERLTKVGTRIYYTYASGEIDVILTRKGYRVKSFCGN